MARIALAVVSGAGRRNTREGWATASGAILA